MSEQDKRSNPTDDSSAAHREIPRGTDEHARDGENREGANRENDMNDSRRGKPARDNEPVDSSTDLT